jgi:hypothetical protein
MVFEQFLLVVKGCVSGVFGIVPCADSRDQDAEKKDEEAILAMLRCDREKGLCGQGIPASNPSLDPSTVEFIYKPAMYKQKLYSRQFPFSIASSYGIIDAFVCLGSRFGLQQLQVFVEVCKSNCGDGRIWANIYYVSDSEIPACIIEAEKSKIFLAHSDVKKRLERDKEEAGSTSL